jgi:transposase
LNLIIELQDVEKASKIMKIPASTAYRWINYWNDDGKEGIKNGQCPELDRIIYIV